MFGSIWILIICSKGSTLFGHVAVTLILISLIEFTTSNVNVMVVLLNANPLTPSTFSISILSPFTSHINAANLTPPLLTTPSSSSITNWFPL